MIQALLKFDKIKETLNDSVEKKRKSVPAQRGNKKQSSGTGYASDSISDINFSDTHRVKAKNAQSKEDSEIELALTHLKSCIEQERNPDGYIRCYEWLSVIMVDLKYLLVNNSLLDIGYRAEVYLALLALVKSIALEPFTTPFLTQIPSGGDTSLSLLVETFASQSKTFLQLYQNQADTVGDDSLADALIMAFDITEILFRV